MEEESKFESEAMLRSFVLCEHCQTRIRPREQPLQLREVCEEPVKINLLVQMRQIRGWFDGDLNMDLRCARREYPDLI